MKPNKKIAALATFLAISVSAYAQGFIRPQIAYVSPTNDVGFMVADGTEKLGGTIGYGIIGGTTFGPQDEHEVSIELSFADFKADVSTNTPFTYGMGDDEIAYSSGRERIKVNSMPILLNYRYYVGDKASSARVYIAPSVGFTHLKLTDTATGVIADSGEIDSITWTDSKNGFTWAIGIGVMVKITDKIDWDIGYRYMSAHAWQTDIKTHTIYTGVGFKF